MQPGKKNTCKGWVKWAEEDREKFILLKGGKTRKQFAEECGLTPDQIKHHSLHTKYIRRGDYRKIFGYYPSQTSLEDASCNELGYWVEWTEENSKQLRVLKGKLGIKDFAKVRGLTPDQIKHLSSGGTKSILPENYRRIFGYYPPQTNLEDASWNKRGYRVEWTEENSKQLKVLKGNLSIEDFAKVCRLTPDKIKHLSSGSTKSILPRDYIKIFGDYPPQINLRGASYDNPTKDYDRTTYPEIRGQLESKVVPKMEVGEKAALERKILITPELRKRIREKIKDIPYHEVAEELGLRCQAVSNLTTRTKSFPPIYLKKLFSKKLRPKEQEGDGGEFFRDMVRVWLYLNEIGGVTRKQLYKEFYPEKKLKKGCNYKIFDDTRKSIERRLENFMISKFFDAGFRMPEMIDRIREYKENEYEKKTYYSEVREQLKSKVVSILKSYLYSKIGEEPEKYKKDILTVSYSKEEKKELKNDVYLSMGEAGSLLKMSSLAVGMLFGNNSKPSRHRRGDYSNPGFSKLYLEKLIEKPAFVPIRKIYRIKAGAFVINYGK